MPTNCDNCDKPLTFEDSADEFHVNLVASNKDYFYCSPTCLTEGAWKFKSEQPKLSKTKPTPLCFDCKEPTDEDHMYVKGIYVCDKCAEKQEEFARHFDNYFGAKVKKESD